MTISEYVCELCEYRYEGCGGLGLLESGEGLQTISCSACEALHDVPLGVNLRQRLEKQPGSTRAKKRRGDRETTMEAALAALTFSCPVDASHAVRPWVDGEPGLAVPGPIVSHCPRCEA